MTFRLPFITPAKKPQQWATPDGTLPTNVNIFKNPIPFSQTDWAPVKPFPKVAQQTVTFNNLLFIASVVAVPFYQTSFPPVAKPVSVPVSQAAYNPNLFSNPIPFAQRDWSKASTIPSVLPELYNMVLATASTAPFYTQDFSKPFFPQARLDASRQLNPNLFTVTTSAPFAQYDWAREFDIPSLPPQAVPYNLNLFKNPIPFNQQDWSKPQAVSDWQPAISWQPSLSIQFAPLPTPFIPVDYNKTFRVPSLPPGSGPLNINLFKNAIPFAQYDWARQRLLQGALYPAPQPYNPNLFSNPIPFAQFDWSKPVRLSGLLPAPLPVNGNLFVALQSISATLGATENIDTAAFALSFSRWSKTTTQSEVWAISIQQAETWTPVTIQSETWTKK